VWTLAAALPAACIPSNVLPLVLLQTATLQERNAAIIRAEGESEAAKLISDATKQAGAGLVELRRIEAAKDIAETMSKSQNVVYLPSGGNMLLGINPR
jgi:prohibitin 1